jgi:hypothetical protein
VEFEPRMSRSGEACTCGTRTPAGFERVALVHVPPSIHRLLMEQTFCSVRCARTFLLEALAKMECEPFPEAIRDVEDLRNAYLEVRRVAESIRVGPPSGGPDLPDD